MSVLFCVSFLAFYLQTAPFMLYLCIGKTKENCLVRTGIFFRVHTKKRMTKDEKRLEVNDKPSGGQVNNQ